VHKNLHILAVMIFDWLLKGTIVVVVFLLHLLGWKRAEKWMDKLVGEGDKEEKPVI
jgi:hypothetical protein